MEQRIARGNKAPIPDCVPIGSRGQCQAGKTWERPGKAGGDPLGIEPSEKTKICRRRQGMGEGEKYKNSNLEDCKKIVHFILYFAHFD